ncbi:MAG: hypothetical protein A2Z59_06175 [Nitrospinae bacterium RIFCSPLOWO2_02_39_17]|nr:MAG: hypothetical protein A2W53_04255 [Nitrospinae bacterium RIFCSPHIGHO2_02_39_11]OGW05985.1 MAG: hypothetical protein A2Z59_06175 [Nitrospinae bacterium RIFCSPLOWO2_02_39_17]HLA47741.1 SLC13 family permease [Nitrospinota bacterium]
MSTEIESSNNTVDIEAKWYFLVCSAIAVLIGFFTWTAPASPNLLGIEVFATIIALFIFGSIKYRIDKNVITYGALLIILVTFFPMWWPKSQLRQEFIEFGGHAIWEATKENILTLHGLEKLVHADTMLFILGLTFFVSVISQTRLLETISMNILRIFEGRVFATVILICALVSFASGIMDGVSMIGLTIRVLTIILIMAKVKEQGIKFFIMVSVVLTTVCGMWLAYGEPPNLIIKSNLGLPDSFFLKYAMPMAVVSFIIVAIFIHRWLMRMLIPLNELDVLEQNIADVKFLQAARKGEIKDSDDMLMEYYDQLGDKAAHVKGFYHEGHHPISAMIRAGVNKEIIDRFIEEYLGEEFLEPVFNYYHFRVKKYDHKGMEQELIEADVINRLLENTRLQRRAAQVWGKIAFIPFIGFLIWHASNHNVPLFIASMAGFGIAFLGILPHTRMSKLAFHEAVHEYKEYLFLFPLFLSISLLTAVGFFDQMKDLIEHGVESIGHAHIAVIQFIFSAFLSAILDNNVVADFASRAIQGMSSMFLFAASQIAGYAAGGSLTHIGSAQSVVAFAYILRYIDSNFTPLDWIRAMWRMVLTISVALIVVIYIMAYIFST